jgi:hypothetical protein
MMKRLPLIGCLVLCVAAATAEAVTVTYTTAHDVYIEWNSTDGGRTNRNSKGLLKQQWSGVPGAPTEVVKSYIKFGVPADLVTINSVTFRLTNLNTGESDNGGDPVEIWALPDAYDGWDEAVLDWNQATSTYANDPLNRGFTAGQAVGSGTCNAGKGVWTDFALDVAKMQALVDADSDGLITLTLAAMTSSYFCDSENSQSSYRPGLIWDYEVPEPATLSLLVLGGLACLRRRR